MGYALRCCLCTTSNQGLAPAMTSWSDRILAGRGKGYAVMARVHVQEIELVGREK